ncbi:Uncharacterised protein [Salmonella enterica subsp. enterica serovar Typhi]|nr:Uncharacterised protein [Salmonella enterica subsp. enterica serovar Typhi]CER44450.1 Uncharacterised protein [Salmonella enterica subsp. enterica serovar Typhi]CER48644.1 Uncharacterised protein [Salmonella enterica subsp. enterica serovar Typhi]CER55088.1 Uncharacterised protein [Salmonella enterica subsp. enterica serovar Typhi]CES12012.1 Uncharacterised protein [Salmonella enterica subsp. enterica serovar Typhi]
MFNGIFEELIVGVASDAIHNHAREVEGRVEVLKSHNDSRKRR